MNNKPKKMWPFFFFFQESQCTSINPPKEGGAEERKLSFRKLARLFCCCCCCCCLLLLLFSIKYGIFFTSFISFILLIHGECVCGEGGERVGYKYSLYIKKKFFVCVFLFVCFSSSSGAFP